MPAIPPTRIQVAARFCADELSINLLLRSWGDSARALIRVGSSSGYVRDPLGTWSYGRWRDQSPLLTYWGPKNSNPDSFDALINSRDQESVLPGHMQELVESYLLSQLDTDTADGLRRKLKEHLRKISLTDFADGVSDQAWDGVLGLASAQNLAAKVADRNELNSTDYDIIAAIADRGAIAVRLLGAIQDSPEVPGSSADAPGIRHSACPPFRTLHHHYCLQRRRGSGLDGGLHGYPERTH